MVKALYICYFGIREPLVQTQVLPYLRELKKDGHEISLLTFEPALGDREMMREGVREIKEELAAVGIEWHWLRYHKRPSVPATSFDVLNGARFIHSLIKTKEFDILHARSHVPMLMAALVRKYSKSRPKLLFDIRGFFPEEYTDSGIWPQGGWLYKTSKRVERWLLSAADGFVVLTEKAREILFANEQRPVAVIPCCVDLNRFAAANATTRYRMRSDLGIGERKTAVYVGATGGWYMTTEMADLFGEFKCTQPEGFAMVLTQSDEKTIGPLLMERGFGPDDLFIKKVMPNQLPEYLCAADIAISFIKPCYSKQASSPTKNAEYLACGLPIIANTGVGDVDELITRNRVGALVREFTSEAYRSTLDEIKELGDVADCCKELARREFDLETVGGKRYREIYERLLA